MENKHSFAIKFLAFVTVIALSWALTCGVLYLAALCFSVTFDLKIATGVWLILMLLRLFFGSNRSKK